MKYRLSFLILIILTSCLGYKGKEVKIVKGFLKKTSLEYSVIKTPSVLFDVGQMIILDSVLVTMDIMASPFFQVFKLPEMEYIGGYIQRGAGPGEEIQIDPFIHRLSGNSFMYKSLKSIKIVEFNLEKKMIEIKKDIKLPGELISLSHIFMLSDYKIFGWDVRQNINKEFIEFDYNTNIISEFGPSYSKIVTDIPPLRVASTFSKIITVKPDKTTFAAVYDKFQMLRIFSSNGKLLRELQFKDSQNLPKSAIIGDFEDINPNDIKTHYHKICSTNKFIYALYSGKTISEISKNNSGINDICKEIHVWDWSGEPVLKISLDKEFFSFSVSSDDSFIVCSSTEALDRLFRYDLDVPK